LLGNGDFEAAFGVQVAEAERQGVRLHGRGAPGARHGELGGIARRHMYCANAWVWRHTVRLLGSASLHDSQEWIAVEAPHRAAKYRHHCGWSQWVRVPAGWK
jgi:hypothetical protein